MTFPSFAEFFMAAHGYAPFPWQVRLADEVLSQGWPDLLDLPTGVGKTSAMDIALYVLARAPERAARRVLLVVDRRIVVDQGAEHARGLLASMRRDDIAPALRAVAGQLREIWGGRSEEDPFAVATLRGGMPRDNDWARRPDQPVLGVSTVDQVGSRLLFRGYGLSGSAKPIHAGLLGNDTLILLDEVHLAIPFAQTLRAIRQRFRTALSGLPDRFGVVQMSATAGAPDSGARIFRLDEQDHAHPVLARRLTASKTATLESVKVRGDVEAEKRETLATAAVAAALAVQGRGATVCAIVVNRVDTARQAWRRLQAEHGSVTASCLLTGRMRPIDRDRVVRERLNPVAGAGRDRGGASPTIVVATQCIEAGADLDFDGLVTECASIDALRQRLGRLDRRGERGHSEAVVLARTDNIGSGDDPVYGKALSATWTWLSKVAEKGRVGLGVAEFAGAEMPDRDSANELLAPRADAPILLPVHLDALAQTSPEPAYSPEIPLWLHGPQRTNAEVQIVWRTELDQPFAKDTAELIAALSVVRPSALEAVAVPIYAARAWLEGRPAEIADVAIDEGETQRRPRDETRTRVFRWDGLSSAWIEPRDIRPGDTLVMAASYGGLAGDNFDPDSKDAVIDLGDLANLRGRGEVTLRLSEAALASWGLDSERAPPVPREFEVLADAVEALREWIAEWPETMPPRFPGTPHEWTLARRVLGASKRVPDVIAEHFVLRARVPAKELPAFELSDSVTEDDDSSFRDGAVTLSVHSDDVRHVVERFARSIGFGPSVVSDLARAAWLHDVGKADPRFQRWLRGGTDLGELEPLAKSALPSGNVRERELARERAGYPTGYRHELLSVRMAEGSEAALEGVTDRDLVLHLVGSHHGWCRPFPPASDHPEDLDVELAHGGITLAAATRHRLARLDSGVSDRYWDLVQRYGWWGLAWLEAVLRLADHRASEGREAR